MKWLKNYVLYFAWMVALAGLLLSLYFGEILQMEPCRLCWYQRIALFPLALFLGIAAYRNEARLAFYSWPLVALGALAALYQTLSLYFPGLVVQALCGAEHCSPVFSFFGFLSFPLLSFIGFTLIALFLGIARMDCSSEENLL